jgi:hypothetical protein
MRYVANWADTLRSLKIKGWSRSLATERALSTIRTSIRAGRLTAKEIGDHIDDILAATDIVFGPEDGPADTTH